MSQDYRSSEPLYECNACDWIGPGRETVHPKHDETCWVCPECHETITPVVGRPSKSDVPPKEQRFAPWPAENEFRSFEAWACACAQKKLEGPYKLIGPEPADYQYIGKNGTAAVWRSGIKWGVIFND